MSTNWASGPEMTRAVDKGEKIFGYRRYNILIVDDDEVSLEIIAAYLNPFYIVSSAIGGQEALKLMRKNQYDLILLDYMMPDMDGPAVFAQIRSDFPVPCVPIVFLTAMAEKDMVIKGLEMHPTDYLLKPVKKQELLDRVRRILESKND